MVAIWQSQIATTHLFQLCISSDILVGSLNKLLTLSLGLMLGYNQRGPVVGWREREWWKLGKNSPIHIDILLYFAMKRGYA
ncbi:hypothetical protein [Ktedonobacter robiniae]|uniref:hypothetical protein n=1 Tax=Ktedonobacter robiniae TaxID=2778365 RepID=UPI001915641F|nr:hypothetical protein [Ktedonobacter robiniae]